jgi:hypothetical protein
MKHKLFCYICKKHIVVEADKKKDAIQRFELFGHDNKKVRELSKDLILSH